MDVLWSPWRYDYINSSESDSSERKNEDCVFCRILKSPATDEEKFILHRAGFNFVILNIYPYVSGHLMIVPYQHLAELDAASKEITDEMMDLAKRAQTALREVYRPNGMNMGMNFGKAAGAGVAEHLSSAFFAALDRRCQFYDRNRTNPHDSRILAIYLFKTERKIRLKAINAKL